MLQSFCSYFTKRIFTAILNAAINKGNCKTSSDKITFNLLKSSLKNEKDDTSIFIIAALLIGAFVYFFPETDAIILRSISGLLTIITIHDSIQTRHPLSRNFPLIAHLLSLLEGNREKI
ncbi:MULTISPECIES: hypothetical protein [unclassified Polaribacter]|uniref:hypothetical protein n=1 Tax=unclassified Polaribacter TaxID=196858 RepID=UPI0011BE6662|nr:MULTISPECIES: hypothetical protein [unclassified Polaribacter]TXD54352.1 hypothetical protein ES043_00430 [Polaribacter sp. IC063]TXD62817.1 hypothetical protein ES044_00330 [Polaribacter sp. IC066]